MRLAVPGWRGRLVIDAYRRLPEGEGWHKQAIDSYVDLAQARGHTLPKKPEHIGQGIKDELHRLSSDSSVYCKNGWNAKRPDMFFKLETGRWGLRPQVSEQIRDLNIGQQDLLAGIPPVSLPVPLIPDLFVTDNPDDFNSVYAIEMPPIQNIMSVSPGQKIVKIGIGGDPFQRRKELQTGNPSPLSLLFYCTVRNASALENKLHRMFEARGLHGEWFVMDAATSKEVGALIAAHGMGDFA